MATDITTPAVTAGTPAPAEVARPRFFLDATYDAAAEDGDWWLDLGGVDLPGWRSCNTFTTSAQA